jgi:hypothetical protein
MYNHKIVNAETGEVTIVPFNDEEIKVMEANIAKSNAELKEAAKKAEVKAALAERLGLTADELALLLA